MTTGRSPLLPRQPLVRKPSVGSEDGPIRWHPLAPQAVRSAPITEPQQAFRHGGSRRSEQPAGAFSVEQNMGGLVPWPVRRIFRLVWGLLCIATLVALPLVYWQFHTEKYAVKSQAWFIGGVFVILSFPISLYEVAMHTEYYTQPRLQRHVIRILWMVPIYGVDAWFALRFEDAREYLDPLREVYEAYVIYNFLAYLLAFLEGTVGDLDTYRQDDPPVQHCWGFEYMIAPWPQGGKFLWECKKGVLNYVILRPLCTVIALITGKYGLYGQGQFSFGKSYMYLVFATSSSQMYALYCLAMLYWNYHDELAPIRPLSKFLCVKAVIFLSFWQGCVLNGLVWAKIINVRGDDYFSNLDLASGIQDFLICIEMFFAALAHTYAFPPRDYMDPNIPTKGFFTNVRYMFDIRDIVDEVQEVLEEHYDTATDGLHHVVRIPQKAIRTAAGMVSDPQTNFRGLFHSRDHSSHSSGVESQSDSHSVALLSVEEGNGGSPCAAGGSAPQLPTSAAVSPQIGRASSAASDASFVTATGGSLSGSSSLDFSRTSLPPPPPPGGGGTSGSGSFSGAAAALQQQLPPSGPKPPPAVGRLGGGPSAGARPGSSSGTRSNDGLTTLLSSALHKHD